MKKLAEALNLIEQPRYGCALAAQQTVLAIPGALPILHAGPGCSAKATTYAVSGAGFQGEGYGGGPHIASSNMDEQDVVFGGENKLRRNVKGALRVLDGDLYAILTGCTADIVGDDTLSVARDFAEEGYPVIGVETAGFKGSNYYGHEEVMRAIIEQYVGERSAQVVPHRVNVFASVPYQDPFWRGDLEEIQRLLTALGLDVHVLFGYGSAGVSEWQQLPEAEFNLLLSPWVGRKTVELLKAQYGTPYLHYPILPVGGAETSRFLREVATYAGLSKRAEKVIAREERRFYAYFEAASDFITEYQNKLPEDFYLVADSHYATGIAAFLVEELGLQPAQIYITETVGQQDQQAIRKFLTGRAAEFQDRVTFESDGGLIEEDLRRRLKGRPRSVILGSNWEKFVAQDTGNLYTYVSLPLNETLITQRSYAGYRGGLALMEDLYSSVFRTGTITR